MLLDTALEKFESQSTPMHAAVLLTVATRYWHDEMIGDESYEDCVRKVRDYLRESAR